MVHLSFLVPPWVKETIGDAAVDNDRSMSAQARHVLTGWAKDQTQEGNTP